MPFTGGFKRPTIASTSQHVLTGLRLRQRPSRKIATLFGAAAGLKMPDSLPKSDKPGLIETATSSSILQKTARRWKDSVDELLEIRGIADNWDGEGALAPSPELVDNAIEFLVQRKCPVPPSRITPVNDGRITLEWDQDGSYVSLSFEAPYRARRTWVKPDGSVEFSEVNWSADQDFRA